MKNIKETFPFHLARKITKAEVEEGRKAIENKLGLKRRSRKRSVKSSERNPD